MEGKSTAVTFGKKRKGGNIRMRKPDNHEDDEETIDDVATKLQEVKNEQMFRKRFCHIISTILVILTIESFNNRHKGLDAESLLTPQDNNRTSSGGEASSHSIKQMMGTQFSAVVRLTCYLTVMCVVMM